MRTWGLALASVSFTVALGGVASADGSFDELAAGAQRLSRTDLEGVAWALTAECNAGEGPSQRLCRAVRDARKATLGGGTYLVDAEPGAFVVGPWDPDAKASLLGLSGCVACARPIAGVYMVSSKAAPTWSGEVAVAASIHQAARGFPTQAAADKWRAIAATAHGQFVVRLGGDKAGLTERDGKKVLAVEILGFRVHQPCDGAIVCASPKASPVAADKSACGQIAEDTTTTQPSGPELPASLTPDALKAVMKPVTEAARSCFDDYGVPGRAKLVYTVAGAGTITAYEQTGDFVDTPTGRCIDKAAKAVTFPAVKKASFSFSYPINVQ